MTNTIKHNKKRPLALLVGIILAGQAPLALATNQVGEFYVGAKAGLTQFANGCDADSLELECDDQSEGVGVYGGYQALDWLALELGYDYLGKAESSYPTLVQPGARADIGAKAQGIELGLKADYALGERAGVFAKGGTLLWQVEKSASAPGLGSVSEKDSGGALMLGAGVEYRLTDNWNTRLEYQYFNDVGGDAETEGSDMHFVGLGLDYRFGGEAASAMAEPVAVRPVDEVVMTEPQALVETVAEPEPPVIESYTDVVSSAFGEVLFESGSTTLSPSQRLQLQPFLDRLKQYPETVVEISGHTDSKGSEAVNQRLSEQRAQSVANYLISKGVAPERITRVVGYGESLPVASNETPIGRAQNRRVEIVSPEVMSRHHTDNE